MTDIERLETVPQPELPDSQYAQLTPRQRQILELLKAGKVNKEIADELGIGLGTVKQHMVALFKKLRVRNRTMAVSQGIELEKESIAGPEPVVVEGMLERRPCVVLSTILPKTLPSSVLADLKQSLSIFALANAGLMLMRKAHTLELIFGIQSCSEYDVLKAYVAAYKMFNSLQKFDNAQAGTIQAAVTAGIAIVSMKRHGGCTGDVIASPAIGAARELAERAIPGSLRLDKLSSSLLQLSQPARVSQSHAFRLPDLGSMPWTDNQELPPMWGRETEWKIFDTQLHTPSDRQSGLIGVQGETGMGKSLLCHHLAQSVKQCGAQLLHWVCFSKHLGPWVYAYPTGKAVDIDTLPALLRRDHDTKPRWIIIDDCQHLRPDILDALVQLSRKDANSVFVFAGRRLGHSLQTHANIVKLGRLSEHAIAQIEDFYTAAPDTDRRLTAKAHGVPLFAKLLALHEKRGESLPFSLFAVIAARIDGLKLDHRLLALLASSPGDGSPLEKIAEQLGESIETAKSAADKAVASGVLSETCGRYRFNHPLLRQAVVESLVE